MLLFGDREIASPSDGITNAAELLIWVKNQKKQSTAVILLRIG